MVKNTFELKNAQRVTLDGNLLENCWSAGQYGYAIVLTPRNSGSAPWTRVQDVTFTNNVVRHVAGVANIAGFDDSDTTLRTERITFRNNLFDDVNHSAYGTNAKALLVGGGAATLVFDRNTIIHTNSSVLYAYGASMPGVVYTNNVSQHHRYGIMGSGASTGKPTIAAFFPGGVFQCNVLAGGTASLYPTPNAFPTVAQWNSAFVNPAAGDYRIASGSALAAAGLRRVGAGRGLSGVACRDGRPPARGADRRSQSAAGRQRRAGPMRRPSARRSRPMAPRRTIPMARSSTISGPGATRCWCALPICRRRHPRQ